MHGFVYSYQHQSISLIDLTLLREGWCGAPYLSNSITPPTTHVFVFLHVILLMSSTLAPLSLHKHLFFVLEKGKDTYMKVFSNFLRKKSSCMKTH
jgi:hypothetical protein